MTPLKLGHTFRGQGYSDNMSPQYQWFPTTFLEYPNTANFVLIDSLVKTPILEMGVSDKGKQMS